MKNFTTLLLFMISFFPILNAQTPKLIELIEKTKCQDFSCYNSYITAKGFSYNKFGKEDWGTYYRYASDEEFVTSSNIDIRTRNQSIFVLYPNNTVGTGFGTSYKPHYQTFMNELNSLGFKSVETWTEEGGTIATEYISVNYSSIRIVFRTMISKIGESYDKSWIYYDFALMTIK